MEFLVISSNKLKIKMNKKEMKRYGMDVTEADYDSPDLRRSLWRVLDIAREECDFSVTGEKLLIQLYPSSEGCEAFVTKLGRLGSAAERTIARSGNVTMLSSKSTLYKFPCLTELLSALRHVRGDARQRCTDLYICDDEVCYLKVEERTGTVPVSDLSILGEYGSEAPITLVTHLCEHSARISAQALFDIVN